MALAGLAGLDVEVVAAERDRTIQETNAVVMERVDQIRAEHRADLAARIANLMNRR